MASTAIPLTTYAFGSITGSFTTALTLPVNPGHVGIDNLVADARTLDHDVELAFNDGSTSNAYLKAGDWREWQLFISGLTVKVKHLGVAPTTGGLTFEGFC